MQDGMHGIESLDLNLLRVLHVLLEEGSVDAAALRLGRSPSAVSHALGRLRTELGDPLLVRSGNCLLPSPRARAMREPLARALDGLGQALNVGASFDPSTSNRSFTLAAHDVLGLLAPELLEALHTEAPGTGLELLRPRADEPAHNLGPGGTDLMLAPDPTTREGLMMTGVGRLDHRVLIRRGHPALAKGGFDAETYARLGHVFVRTETPGLSIVQQAVNAARLSRRISIVVPSFTLAPLVVARSDLIFTTPEPLVRSLLRPLDLVLLPLPIAMPAVVVAAVWHRRDQEDAGHRWFRNRTMQVIRDWIAQDDATASPPGAEDLSPDSCDRGAQGS